MDVQILYEGSLNGSGVYQIKNLINNKIYIGSSVNLSQRRNNHFSKLTRGCHANKHLQSAWNKYGKDNFIFEVLINCGPSMCIWYEQQFIDQWKPEYNQAPNAGNNIGIRRTEEEKKHLSIINKGKVLSEENKLALIEANTGRKQTEYTKKRIRESVLGTHHSEESKRKISSALKGIIRPEKVFSGFISPKGEEFKNIFGLVQFCKEKNLNYSNMIQVDLGKRKTHKGWRKL